MKKQDFRIKEVFWCNGNKWYCTDIGTRNITAIRVSENFSNWCSGPPYALAESVFDEHSQEACEQFSPKEQELQGLEDSIKDALEIIQQQENRLNRLFSECEKVKASIRTTHKDPINSRAGMKWTNQEMNQLIREFKDGYSYADIVRFHLRSDGAIKSKLSKLGLIKYDKYTNTYKKVKDEDVDDTGQIWTV